MRERAPLPRGGAVVASLPALGVAQRCAEPIRPGWPAPHTPSPTSSHSSRFLIVLNFTPNLTRTSFVVRVAAANVSCVVYT